MGLTALAAGNTAWLLPRLGDPKQGVTQWTLVFATGGFGADPLLASGMRRYAVDLLHEVGTKGDTVRVVSAEMGVWGSQPIVAISDLAQSLPRAPMPESRGGHDIEKVLSEVAQTAAGPILFFSPGPSQLPKDGKGKLMGGDGTVPGFGTPVYQAVTLSTPEGPREVQVTLLTKPGFFKGDLERVPIRTPSPAPVGGNPATLVVSPGPWSPNATVLVALGSAALGLVAGFLARRPKKPDESPRDSNVAGELEDWKREAKSLQRRMDQIAQEISESASSLSERTNQESIELREEVHRGEKALKVWHQTAMDFLDGIDRTFESPILSDEGRKALERVANQFIALTQRAGLDLISPEIGAPVLDGHHSIEAVRPAPAGSAPNTVARVLQLGFRRGDEVIRTAKIEMFGEDQ